MTRKVVQGLLVSIALTGVISGCHDDSSAIADTAAAQGPAITGADAPHKTAAPAINDQLPPLPIEETGHVAVLPKSYPASWVMVNEASFFNMFGGKVIVLDIAETQPAKRIKGMMDKNLLGNFGQSKTRGELYIMESFHERGSRGPKTDVLTIYDKTTLTIKKEIVWPQANRLMALPERYAVSLSDDEKYLFVSNFSPAASFTVVNLDSHTIVEEISTPGCVLTYPVGDRGVASLCSNGGMLSTGLNDDGTLKSQQRLSPFFDTVESAIFEHPVYYQGKAYFPSFHGLLHSFDMSGDTAKYLGSWDMVTEEEKQQNWRPSGLILNDVDDNGLMYTIFQPDGHEGSQTHGGTQVWVFDLNTQKRVRIIDVPSWAVSIAVTRGNNPLLVVTNGEMNLDIFNTQTGKLIQTVADFGNITPLGVDKSY